MTTTATVQDSDACPDLQCRNPGLDSAVKQPCLGVGVVTDAFVCPDDGGRPVCTINKSLVDDNVCDCPGTCADETNYTCQNCSCVAFCGLPSRWECSPFFEVFRCPAMPPLEAGCTIPSFLVNNQICDCPWTCADEEPVQNIRGQEYLINCEICECPTACQQLYSYYGGEYRFDPDLGVEEESCVRTQEFLQRPRFQCPPPGNCSLPIGYVNDNHCDCPGTCADEEDWDCDTCVCPDICGIKNRNCFDVYFACPLSNCTISIFSLNDASCDCPGCEDESNFTCDTCVSGCPTNQTCHNQYYYGCEYRLLSCPGTELSGSDFTCFIPASYLNDNFCDCPDCTDEVAWDCGNCSSGCRSTCVNPQFLEWDERGTNQQRAVNCFGQQFNLNFAVQCPGYPARSGFPATKLGCAIPYAALNDNRCDCPTCRDEAFEDCEVGVCSSSVFCSPGGVNSLICKCPSSCGEPTSCAGKCTGDPLLYGTGALNRVPPQLPPECIYFCPGAFCGKHVQILNNSVCDCVNCEDEANWSCDTCQCPAAPLTVFSFNEQGCGFQPLDVVLQGKGLVDNAVLTKLPCYFPAPFPRRKLPDGIDGSITHELLERASKTPRNNQRLGSWRAQAPAKTRQPMGFAYSIQQDVYADFLFTNDVGYLPDGTPMNKAGNCMNHPENIGPDPHAPGSPLPRANFVNDVGYLPDGTPMNMAGNAINHPENISADPHSPGSALPPSSYAADIGYLVDGTPLDAAGNNAVH
eukprot:s2906_g4.t1